jgi:signal transduction histidine kinase
MDLTMTNQGLAAPDLSVRGARPDLSSVQAGTGALRLGWSAALWLALALLSAWVLVVPRAPVALNNPLLAVALATTAGIVGLAIAQLGSVRFLVLGGRFDLYTGLAFGVLSVTHLGLGVVRPVSELDPLTPNTVSYLTIFGRGLATLLLLLGLIGADRTVPLAARSGFVKRRAAATLLAVMAGTALILAAGPRLPELLDPRTTDILTEPNPILEAMPGQSHALLVLTGTIGVARLVAALGYVALARRLADAQLAWLASALMLFSFAELHALLFPPLSHGWVSIGDGFNMAGYLLLLFSMVLRLSGEIAERASREERLRLSRELHDGLAQQLGLLNLRLSRAAAPDRSPEVRDRNLQAAKRLLEAASLEARQAITALRTGRVTWEEFTRTLSVFADEFSNNHEVEVRLETQGQFATLDASLQAEVLRLLQEAFSNAVRHGRARSIDVMVSAQAGALEVSVQDDGAGFDPREGLAGPGIGLKSIGERLERRGGTLRLVSAPGRGALIRGRLPIGSPGGARA